MTHNAVIDQLITPNKKKSSGGIYDLFKATIIDGPLDGMSVFASRTTLNQDKVEKSTCEIDEKVILHMETVDGNPFFSIERASMDINSNEEIMEALAKNAKQDQKIETK